MSDRNAGVLHLHGRADCSLLAFDETRGGLITGQTAGEFAGVVLADRDTTNSDHPPITSEKTRSC
jgi:hypothetical protein